MKAYERLIKYAKVHTASAEDNSVTPSTERQFDLANILADEMKDMGVSDVYALLRLRHDPGDKRL